MSKLGKALLGLVGLAVIVGGLSRFLLADRPDFLWIPFAVAAVFFALEVIVDFKLYKEFLGMRTTKHGMNMGLMILLVVGLLVGVNFLVAKKGKKWDFTTEHLHTLSEQSSKLLKSLDQDLMVYAFFREDSQTEETAKFEVRRLIDLMDDETNKVKFEFVNALKRPDLVQEYNVTETPVLVLKYKGKTTTITDLSEEAVANGIVKVTRERNKRIYFLAGHGELDLENQQDSTGGTLFKKSLQDSSYDLAKLSLIEKPEVPADADVVLILGPRQSLLEPELQALTKYLERGGNLFVAADPGQKHGLRSWLQKFGVNLEETYVIDQVGQMIGQSAAVAIGMEYSRESEITKNFTNQMTAFELASPVSKMENAPAGFRVLELVKSSPASFSKNQISGQVTFVEGTDKKGPLPLVVSVQGSLGSKAQQGQAAVEKEKQPEFNLVVVGDSEFLSNRMLPIQLNRDLALNSVSFLAKDDELIAVKPKQLARTKLQVTNTQMAALVWGVYLPIPILLLVAAGIIWWRRRGA